MLKKKILLFFGLIFFILSGSSIGIENKILIKIENQIITSLDINNEYKYLVALNPSIKNSKKDDILKLSKRSVLQERIKKIEIEKNFKNIHYVGLPIRSLNNMNKQYWKKKELKLFHRKHSNKWVLNISFN